MKSQYQPSINAKAKGFTLLEVLLVIALMGLIVSVIQFNFSGKRPEDVLQKTSYQFAELFESAANYGLLNNIELGLYIHENTYRFLGYDGVKWTDIPEQTWLTEKTLPEGVTFTLTLDDLPIEDPLLFDSSVFKAKDEEYLSFAAIEEAKKAEKEKLIYPQVYILSGGDFTPFSLTFEFSKEVDLYGELSQLAYRVTGIYNIPLTVEGPVLDD